MILVVDLDGLLQEREGGNSVWSSRAWTNDNDSCAFTRLPIFLRPERPTARSMVSSAVWRPPPRKSDIRPIVPASIFFTAADVTEFWKSGVLAKRNIQLQQSAISTRPLSTDKISAH